MWLGVGAGMKECDDGCEACGAHVNARAPAGLRVLVTTRVLGRNARRHEGKLGGRVSFRRQRAREMRASGEMARAWRERRNGRDTTACAV